MIMKRYSPVGNGPQKSTWTVCHGSGGRQDIYNGSGQFSGPLAWHATHFSIACFILSSIPTFSRISFFDATITKNNVCFVIYC